MKRQTIGIFLNRVWDDTHPLFKKFSLPFVILAIVFICFGNNAPTVTINNNPENKSTAGPTQIAEPTPTAAVLPDTNTNSKSPPEQFPNDLTRWDFVNYSEKETVSGVLYCPYTAGVFDYRSIEYKEPLISDNLQIQLRMPEIKVGVQTVYPRVFIITTRLADKKITEFTIPLEPDSQTVKFKKIDWRLGELGFEDKGKDLKAPIDYRREIKADLMSRKKINETVIYSYTISYFSAITGEHITDDGPFEYEVQLDTVHNESAKTFLGIGTYAGYCLQQFEYYIQ